jgi:hypothetical protein
MASDWTLVEYRPGRYIKISPTGAFLGKATEREVRAWFAARGGLLTMAPEPQPVREPVEPPRPVSGSPPGSVDAAEDEEPSPQAKPLTPTVPEATAEREPRARRKPSPSRSPEVAAPPGAAHDEEIGGSSASEAQELPTAAGEQEVGDRPVSEPQQSPADGVGDWLWVDPRQESGFQPSSFDLEAFLRRAIALFQAKDWTRGQRPGRLAVHPQQRADGLEPTAEALGLEVVSDPLVSPGTYRLGLAELGAGDRARKRD